MTAQIYGSETWTTEVWLPAVERYYIENFQLPEGTGLMVLRQPQ